MDLDRLGVRGQLLLMEEILHQLIYSLSHYLQGLCIPGGAGFLPSTVSSLLKSSWRFCLNSFLKIHDSSPKPPRWWRDAKPETSPMQANCMGSLLKIVITVVYLEISKIKLFLMGIPRNLLPNLETKSSWQKWRHPSLLSVQFHQRAWVTASSSGQHHWRLATFSNRTAEATCVLDRNSMNSLEFIMKAKKNPTLDLRGKKPSTWQFLVTFLGWLEWPF